jgi:hypothetical protein
LQTQLGNVTSALAEKIDVPFQTRILGNKHSKSNKVHQSERKPWNQPISIECSSIKPWWFLLGFVESTNLIG